VEWRESLFSWFNRSIMRGHSPVRSKDMFGYNLRAGIAIAFSTAARTSSPNPSPRSVWIEK